MFLSQNIIRFEHESTFGREKLGNINGRSERKSENRKVLVISKLRKRTHTVVKIELNNVFLTHKDNYNQR